MSRENVELVQRGFQHVERTGEFTREGVRPDFVWNTTTFRGGMRPRVCVGIDETNEWLAEWLAGFENWSVELEEILDGGDRVVTVARQRANAKHGGPAVEMRFAHVWTFQDGVLTRTEM